MARTRKSKGRQAVRNGGFPGWALFVVGIIVGAVAMAVVMHQNLMPISRPDQAPRPAAANGASNGGPGIAANPTTSNKPRYDFYSVLPEKEVVIPDAQLTAQAKAEQAAQPNAAATPVTPVTPAAPGASTTPAATAAGGDNYLLQVASFPTASQASDLKAKLAFKGFRAQVQPVTINGQTWSRVRLGPYTSASALEKAKQQLEADGYTHVIALKEH
ncbi:MAG TPA: SPOR domain-containing protein [Rhodanobacteraceae bacterium]